MNYARLVSGTRVFDETLIASYFQWFKNEREKRGAGKKIKGTAIRGIVHAPATDLS